MLVGRPCPGDGPGCENIASRATRAALSITVSMRAARLHVALNFPKFEMEGLVDNSVYAKMAEQGFYLTAGIPKAQGGLGLNDVRYSAIVCEELEDMDCGSLFANLGNDMVLAYFTESCAKEQQAK